MKKQTLKILLIILIIIFLVNIVFIFSDNTDDIKNPETNITGQNSNGTVYKTICGNMSTNDTAVIILGVHSFENGTHNATNQTIMNMTNNNNLSKKYVVYFIKLNLNQTDLNTSDYQTNRHMGEMLAYDYIVKDLKQYNPYVVVDVHEMEEYWDPDRYIQVMSPDKPAAFDYAHKMENDTGIAEYNFTEGTSPQWVTEPIANEGFNTILFEYGQGESQQHKLDVTTKLIKSIDSLDPSIRDKT